MSSSSRAKKSILSLLVVNIALLIHSGMMAEDLKAANRSVICVRTARSDLGSLRLAVLSIILDRLILQNKQSEDVGLEIKHYSEKLNIDLLNMHTDFKGDKKLQAKADDIAQAATAYNTAVRTQLYPRIATSQFEEMRSIGEQLRPNYEKAMKLSDELSEDAIRASKERAQFDRAIFLTGAFLAVALAVVAYFSVPKN